MIDLPGMAVIWNLLPEARVVGGAVRDMLAGRNVADVDFAVPLPPAEVMSRGRRAGLQVVPTGLAHGTVTVVAGGKAFEVTTLRRDVRTDGRHAIVEFTDDWRVDAARRDFTINAMSADRSGNIFDYFDGRADLAAGRVRFVGRAMLRIAEDHLRILRFFRFFAWYGRGPADAQALAAVRELAASVMTVAAERVWVEFKRLLAAPDPVPALELMQQAGVLERLMPVFDLGRLETLVRRMGEGSALIRLAALTREPSDLLAVRWRLSNDESEMLRLLQVPNWLGPGADEAALRRALAEAGADVLIARTWLGQNSDDLGWTALRTRLGQMARPVFPLHGRDVVALGVEAGPEVGKLLRAAYDWWREGGCTANDAACRAWLEAHVEKGGQARELDRDSNA